MTWLDVSAGHSNEVHIHLLPGLHEEDDLLSRERQMYRPVDPTV